MPSASPADPLGVTPEDMALGDHVAALLAPLGPAALAGALAMVAQRIHASNEEIVAGNSPPALLPVRAHRLLLAVAFDADAYMDLVRHLPVTENTHEE